MQKNKKTLLFVLIPVAVIFVLLIAAGTTMLVISWGKTGSIQPGIPSPRTPAMTSPAENKPILQTSPILTSVKPQYLTATLSDVDLPKPPIKGMSFSFAAPAAGDPGPGKIQARYFVMGYAIWFGVTDGKLWVYHLPKKEALPATLQNYYEYLGIDNYTTYEEQTGKYWLEDLPPWLDISKYDPNVQKMPNLLSVESTAGQAVINYRYAE